MLDTQKVLLLAAGLGVALVVSPACVSTGSRQEMSAVAPSRSGDAIIHVRGVT